MMKISLDKKDCIICGMCLLVCPNNAICLVNETTISIDESVCIMCHLCEQICPQNAVHVQYQIGWDI